MRTVPALGEPLFDERQLRILNEISSVHGANAVVQAPGNGPECSVGWAELEKLARDPDGFWAAYFDTCGDRLVPAAEAPSPSVVLLAPPMSPAPFTANDQAPRRDDDDVHTLVVAADDPSSPPPAAAEAHAGDGDGALEDFLHAVLTPAGASSDAEDTGGDAALEAEFAALLRGESGSSISLESADEPETK